MICNQTEILFCLKYFCIGWREWESFPLKSFSILFCKHFIVSWWVFIVVQLEMRKIVVLQKNLSILSSQLIHIHLLFFSISEESLVCALSVLVHFLIFSVLYFFLSFFYHHCSHSFSHTICVLFLLYFVFLFSYFYCFLLIPLHFCVS